jgi:AraC family transcriptional regulator
MEMLERAPGLVEISRTSEGIDIIPVISSRTMMWESILVEKYKIPDNGYAAPEMSYSSDTIIIQVKGMANVSSNVEGKLNTDTLINDDIAIIPKGFSFVAGTEGENEFLVIHLSSSFLAQTACETSGSDRYEIIPNMRVQDPVINRLGLLLLMEAEAEGSTGRLYGDSLSSAMAAHLIKKHSVNRAWKEQTGGLSKSKLKLVIDYIRENIQEDTKLSSLAAIAHMSPYHFARAFKQSTGLTPIQYLIRCRIERAREMLKKSDLSIAEIAYQVGFSSQSHFHKFFIRLTNTTPGRYRSYQ